MTGIGKVLISFHPSLVSPHVETEARHVCLHIATWCASSSHCIQTSSSCPSLITIRLQVTFGLPFFLLSSGFQVNATVTRLLDSLLNMCPIYLQRLLRMVSLTGLVLVSRYSSSFEVFIGHLILMIFFKHTRWNLSSVMGYTDEWMESLAV